MTIWNDLRSSFRSLARAPGFTLVTLLTLTLGIGATTVIFSFVNAVLIESLPYRDPGELVRVWGSSRGFANGNVNPLDALDLREQCRSCARFAIHHQRTFTVQTSETTVRTGVARVTSDFFPLLGVNPMLGRNFTRGEETPGNERKVLLTAGFWESAYGADRSVIGKTITVADRPATIVGVLPRGFRSPLAAPGDEPLLWMPLAIDRENQGRGGHFMQAIARLRNGSSIEVANGELRALMAALERRYPDSNNGYSVQLERLDETIVGEARRPLLILMAAVAVVLLIACTNVANLFLARGASRGRELSIRATLGAGRVRLVRLLGMEALILGLTGSALAIGLVAGLGATLRNLTEGLVPRANSVAIDPRMLAFTTAAGLVATLLFGIAPAVQAGRSAPLAGLRDASRSSGLGRGAKRSMRGFVILQIAMSLVLVVAGGLVLRSLHNLTRVDPGFDVDRVAALELSLGPARYESDEQIFAFHRELQSRLLARGAAAVGITNILPFGGNYSCDGYTIEGTPAMTGGDMPCAETRYVSPGYFSAMGLRLKAGRYLDERDRNPEAPAVVITESMARRIGADPFARRIRLSMEGRPWATVAGVVEDVRHFGLADEVKPEIYIPIAVYPYRTVIVVARGAGTAADVLAPIREEVRRLDPALPLNKLTTMRSLVDGSIARNRLQTILLGGFGLLALLLAAGGIFGVLSYLVAGSRPEIGVRMALGADRGRVLRHVLRDAARMVVPGIALGVAASLGCVRLVRSLLFGVEPADSLTYVAAIALLGVVSIAAALHPALRASRLDPATVLRTD